MASRSRKLIGVAWSCLKWHFVLPSFTLFLQTSSDKFHVKTGMTTGIAYLWSNGSGLCKKLTHPIILIILSVQKCIEITFQILQRFKQ